MTEVSGTVEVMVGYFEGKPMSSDERFVGRRVRFEGELIHQVHTGYELLRLYRCPEGFRVYENDDLLGKEDGGYMLYPARGAGYPPEDFGFYTAEELGEGWPALADAAGIRETS